MAETNHQRGVQACREGRLADALSLLDRSLLERETSERWNDWATVQLLSGRHAEAEVGYRRALQMEAGNTEAAGNLGALLAGSARPLEALRCLESIGEKTDSVEHLLALCREALAKQPPGDVATEKLEQRSSRAISIQGGAVASLLLRALALENALSDLAAHQGSAAAPLPTIIPTIRASDILPDSEAVELANLDSIDNVALRELCLLIHLCRLHGPRGIFEIGPADWQSARNLASAAGEESEVFMLAPHRPGTQGIARGAQSDRKIVQLAGDSADFDFSPFFNSIDLVSIDGCDDYEHTLHDSRTALRLLRGGKGMVTWRNYGSQWPGVIRAVNELFVRDSNLADMKHIEGTNLVYAKVGHEPGDN